jgi:DNA processing protein
MMGLSELQTARMLLVIHRPAGTGQHDAGGDARSRSGRAQSQGSTARAALTSLFEPGDLVGRALVAKHGAHAALRIAIGARPAFPFWDVTADELAEAPNRWAPRIHGLDTGADLAIIERLGGGFLTPEDEHRPEGPNDLPDAPYGLWYRGNLGKGIPAPSRH